MAVPICRSQVCGLSPRVRGNRPASVAGVSHWRSIPACAGEPLGARHVRRNQQVYPRVCGGTGFCGFCLARWRGLSPRVRGNLPFGKALECRPRSIPACAGEPAPPPDPACPARVYPRVCGGTGVGVGVGVGVGGLSPRVRGNQGGDTATASGQGSIPACAGEPFASAPHLRPHRVYPRVCGGTCAFTSATAPAWGLSPRVRGNQYGPCDGNADHRVYPRVCGGTSRCAGQSPRRWGLSPRVRGNPPPAGALLAAERSIPACAGEPVRISAWSAGRRVYPRVCGGTASPSVMAPSGRGLSPRVRGNPNFSRRRQRLKRSIPACAGEPRSGRTCDSGLQVYPRVCGGTSPMTATHSFPDGLSPRVRGNPLAPALPTRRRSIPACAGEPRRCSRPASAGRVYPRVCGGTVRALVCDERAGGLSPRVRGNPAVVNQLMRIKGSIPACAGEPTAPADGRPREMVYPRVCGGTSMMPSNMDGARGLSPRVRGNRERSPRR